MTDLIAEGRTKAARAEQDYVSQIMFARTATITHVRNHIKSLRQVVEVKRKETALLQAVSTPEHTKVAVVRWILLEGSNLRELYKPLKGNLFARYILDRRAMAMITQQYPSLKNGVTYLVGNEYRPDKWPPICLLEGYTPLEANETDVVESSYRYRMLNHVLVTQTDYIFLMELHSRVARRMDEVAAEKRKRAIEASCYIAIANTFPEFAALAREEAERLNPNLKKH